MQDRITVRMTDEMIARIDLWVAAQPGYVSRQEAVRRFVEFALENADQVSQHGHEPTGPSAAATGSAVPTRPRALV